MPKKGLFLDEKNPYQKECLDLLEVCGHKQGRFLGLVVHDFLTRTGIDVSKMDKKKMQDYMQFLEVQFEFGNPWQQPQAQAPPFVFPMQPYFNIPSEPSRKETASSDVSDNMIRADDMADMENALSAFGIA